MSKTTSMIRTSELWERLFKAPTAEQYFAQNADGSRLTPFAEYIRGLCQDRGETPEQISKRGGVERSYGHYLFRGERNPSRDTVLQLAFGFGLSADETQQLLKHARHSPLHPKVKRDAVIAHCLYKGESIISAQLILSELGLPLFKGV